LIGSILDKYEVLQKVGEGGMATVYRGRHTTLGRDVAIKVLHPHLSSSTRNRKRFAREARAIEHLRHDNILEIFDYSGADAEDCYIVTEFVGGRTLTGFMDEHGRLPSEIATIIGIALAEALAYAHDASVLHRDLKPDNVMIRFDGTVKLMDFGIARFLDESQVTMTGALVGSPAFMSPEQAREGDLDLRSDLFSLGTLLFYLCSGHLPFAGSNPSLILKNIIEGNRPGLLELAPSVSATLADVVERLLQTDREGRFDDARQVAEQLHQALAEVRVDPTSARFSLCAWLEDADAYANALDDHLREVLLSEGRRLLEIGESLAALRLLNRLLALDEDNAEVLTLIQGLHQDRPRRVTAPWFLAGGAALIAAIAFLVVGILTGWLPIPGLSGAAETPITTSTDPVTSDPSTAATATTEPDPGSSATTADPEVGAVGGSDTDSSEGTTDSGGSTGPDVPPGPGAGTGSDPGRGTTGRVRTGAMIPPGPNVGRAGEGTAEDTDAAASGTTEPEPPRLGFLYVRVSKSWGKVRIDDSEISHQTNERGPIEVEPGNHKVTVSHPLAYPEVLDVTVAAGETVERHVDLRFQPLVIHVPEAWNKRCAARLAGIDAGTLGELGYQLTTDRIFDGTVSLQLDCPGSVGLNTVLGAMAMNRLEYTLPEPARP